MSNEDLRAAAMVGAATAVADIARRLDVARLKVPHGWLAAFDAAEVIVAKTDLSELADRVVSMLRAGTDEFVGDPAPKPCPFCGHGMPDHLQLPQESGWRVICESCDAMGPEEATANDATLAWNTRMEVSRD